MRPAQSVRVLGLLLSVAAAGSMVGCGRIGLTKSAPIVTKASSQATKEELKNLRLDLREDRKAAREEAGRKRRGRKE